MSTRLQTRAKTIEISSGAYLPLSTCFGWSALETSNNTSVPYICMSFATACNLVGPVADAATAATNESTQGALCAANTQHILRNIDPSKYFIRSSGAAVSGFFIINT